MVFHTGSILLLASSSLAPIPIHTSRRLLDCMLCRGLKDASNTCCVTPNMKNRASGLLVPAWYFSRRLEATNLSSHSGWRVPLHPHGSMVGGQPLFTGSRLTAGTSLAGRPARLGLTRNVCLVKVLVDDAMVCHAANTRQATVQQDWTAAAPCACWCAADDSRFPAFRVP